MLSRQAAKLAKKDLLPISPNLGAFASLRETQFFLIFSLSPKFQISLVRFWIADFRFENKSTTLTNDFDVGEELLRSKNL